MKKLLRYFLHVKTADKLPRLPRGYTSDFDREALDRDASRLMGMSAIRSPHGMKRLMRRHKASGRDLVLKLPMPKRQRRDRLMPLLRRLAGTTPYNPAKRYMPPRDKRRIVYVPRGKR